MAVISSTRVPARARAAMSRAIATTVILPQRVQHARSLHFGLWCSHLKPDHNRRDCRRHRVLRYCYMDNINRKLSWDNGSHSHDARLAMKRAMAHLMSDKRSTDSKYVNVDNVQSWSDDISGLRPGRNIEDAERDAIDHLFRSRGKASYEHDLWMAPLRNIQAYLSSNHTPKDVSLEDVLTATKNDCDAHKSTSNSRGKSYGRHLSNRRRQHQNVATATSQVIHAHAPRSACTPRNNQRDNGPDAITSPPRDVDSYGPALWNEPNGLPTPSAEEQSKLYPDLDSYRSTTWNDDGISERPAEDLSKDYSDLHKYKPAAWNEPDGLQPKTPEELSKNYDDLSAYAAVRWNEPDGLPTKSPEELCKDHDDLDKYTAVQWNEPDGLPKPTAEELSKKYDDLDKYKPVEWNEPEGLHEPTLEEQSKKYEDLAQYSSPFTAPDATIEAHAASQLDETVKAAPLQEKVDIPSTPAQYEDLEKYGPVLWNEPDGLLEPTAEEKSKNYDDLHLYGAVQRNEPHGLPKPTAEELSKSYEDLPAYEALSRADHDFVTTRVHPEEASKQYPDLSKYEAFENDGPATTRLHPEEASKAYDDLDLYRASTLDEVDIAYPTHPEEAGKAYPDLEAYKPVFYHEPNGLSDACPASGGSGLDAFDKGTTTHIPSTSHYASEVQSRNKHYPSTNSDVEDSLTAAEIRARMSRDPADKPLQRLLDEDMAKHESEWDVASAEAQEAVKHSKHFLSSELTGNPVRDFPDDMTQAWPTESASSSLSPNEVQTNDLGPATSAEDSASKDDLELSSMDESFPLIRERLKPALDRPNAARHISRLSSSHDIADPYSKIPQGLETSYKEECSGASTWPTMVKHYRSQSGTEQQRPVARGGLSAEGIYKVLAYDQNTQSVSVAEMTSSVLDQQSALSPSEVMLKLSNPARFLPYFGSLHSQGYEVVSGSGDVLIFRKVRDSFPDSNILPSSQPAVNPIDLMGRPVMGNFASPTGFVNYESLTADDALKPEPPFRSNMDVRKEESVFSGSKTEQEHGGHQGKKKSLGRKIAVGGVWTVGIAYAAGVLAEYFSTGGFDGLGARGL